MYTQMTAHVQDCVFEEDVHPEIFNIYSHSNRHDFLCSLQTSNRCIRPKYRSPSILLLHPMKKIVSNESGEQSAMIKHCSRAKTVQNISKQTCWWILMSEDNGGLNFKLEGGLLWIMAKSNCLKLKHFNDGLVSYRQISCSLHKMLID